MRASVSYAACFDLAARENSLRQPVRRKSTGRAYEGADQDVVPVVVFVNCERARNEERAELERRESRQRSAEGQLES